MNGPQMLAPRLVAPDTEILPSFLPVPGFGVLAVHSFLLRATEPVLVDTGLSALRAEFLERLASVIAPEDLRWIWLTHIDADHIGSLPDLLERAPQATVVTSFVGMAKLGLNGIQPKRVHLINPGQKLRVGDRELSALTPPTFDAPETTGFVDTKTGVLFSSDSFGALLPAPADDASAVDTEALHEGMVTWATVDAPWLSIVDPDRFGDRLARIAALDPSAILSSHLPPARGMTEIMLGNLAAATSAPAFMGPDQAAMAELMAAN